MHTLKEDAGNEIVVNHTFLCASYHVQVNETKQIRFLIVPWNQAGFMLNILYMYVVPVTPTQRM